MVLQLRLQVGARALRLGRWLSLVLGAVLLFLGSWVPSAAAIGQAGYTYDGRLVSAQVGTNPAQTFSYDDRNLLVSSAGPSGSSAFTYTPAGRVASRSDVAGTATYAYSNGQLASLTDPVSGARVSYGYDAADRPTTITYGSGGRSSSVGYDAAGRVTSDVITASGSTLYGFQNTWTGDQLSGQTVVGAGADVGAATYTYDRSGRLASWTPPSGTGESYTYDADGNRTSVNAATASYDARDRLVSAGSTTYAYTPRGTLLSTTSPTLTRTTAENAFDQLASDTGVTNTYDGLGRLATAGASTFSYAGFETGPVSDGTSTFGRAAGLISTTAGGVVSFDVTNTRGDLIAQASTTGAVTGTRAYAPYGTVSASTGVFSSALGYQGGWTSGSGLVDMSARWYDPATGAFTSHDPLNAGNPYAYASGDPVTHNDPTGLFDPGPGGCGSQCLAGIDFSSVDGVIAGNGVAGAGEAAPAVPAPEVVPRVMPAPEVVAPQVVAPELPTVVPGSFGVSSAFQATAMALSQAEGASGASGYGGGPAVHAHPGTYAHPGPTAGAGSSPSGSGAGSGSGSGASSRDQHEDPRWCLDRDVGDLDRAADPVRQRTGALRRWLHTVHEAGAPADRHPRHPTAPASRGQHPAAAAGQRRGRSERAQHQHQQQRQRWREHHAPDHRSRRPLQRHHRPPRTGRHPRRTGPVPHLPGTASQPNSRRNRPEASLDILD